MNRIDKNISVVVPVYNSQETIEKLVEKLKSTLSCFSKYSIILINDNSVDNSFEIIKSIAKEDENIIAVNLLKNVGQQKATLLGLKYTKGDYIIVIDDDLANDPNDILALYDKIQKGYDVVYAINRNTSSNSLLRNFGSKIRDKMFDAITQKPIDTKVSSYRIISREIKEKTIKASTDFIYISMEILKHTTNIGNIYVDYAPGSTTNYGIGTLANLVWKMYIYYSNQKIFKTKLQAKDTYKFGEIINGDRL